MAKTDPPSDNPPTLQEIRALAETSANIAILAAPKKKAKRRGITRPQVESCIRKGTIDEGPFRNERGDWQVTLYRHAAGEEMRVVIILKDGKILVRSNH
jgi:hypothetical protein